MTPKPSSKTIATAVAGALVTIGAWAIGMANVEIPAEVAAACVLLVSTVIALFVPATSGTYVDTSTPTDDPKH